MQKEQSSKRLADSQSQISTSSSNNRQYNMAHLLEEEPSDSDVTRAWVDATEPGDDFLRTYAASILAHPEFRPGCITPAILADPSCIAGYEGIPAEQTERYNAARYAVFVKEMNTAATGIIRFKKQMARIEALPAEQRDEVLFELQDQIAAVREWVGMMEQVGIDPATWEPAATHVALDNTQLLALVETSEIQEVIAVSAMSDLDRVTAHSSAGVVYPDSIPDNACEWEKAKEFKEAIEAGKEAMERVSECYSRS